MDVNRDEWSFSPGHLMTGQQVGRVFGVNTKTVRRWAEAGLLTTIKTPGGTRRYSRKQVVDLLMNGTIKKTDG